MSALAPPRGCDERVVEWFGGLREGVVLGAVVADLHALGSADIDGVFAGTGDPGG